MLLRSCQKKQQCVSKLESKSHLIVAYQCNTSQQAQDLPTRESGVQRKNYLSWMLRFSLFNFPYFDSMSFS